MDNTKWNEECYNDLRMILEVPIKVFAAWPDVEVTVCTKELYLDLKTLYKIKKLYHCEDDDIMIEGETTETLIVRINYSRVNDYYESKIW